MNNEIWSSDLDDFEYAEVEQAVLETARGRWFLAEFSKRNRKSETTLLLSAIERLERAISSDIEINEFQKIQSDHSQITTELDILFKEIYPNYVQKNGKEIIVDLANSIAQNSFNLALAADKIRDHVNIDSDRDDTDESSNSLNQSLNKIIDYAANLIQNSKNISAFAAIYSHFESRFDSLIDHTDRLTKKECKTIIANIIDDTKLAD